MSAPRLRVMAMVERMGYGDGGAEKLAVAIASRLDPERFRSSLCVTRWDENASEREDVRRAQADLDAAGVQVTKLERNSRWDFRAWHPFMGELRREVDVLHAHMVGSNAWAAILGRLAKTPVIVAHEHMWSFSGSPGRRFLDRDLIGRGCDLFLTVSEQSRQSMIDIEGVNPEKIEALRNGIPDRPPGDGSRVRLELGIEPDEALIGSVGLLREEKAFEVLIEATKLLVDRGRRVQLVLVGDGPEREGLERQIEELGIGASVTITGVRMDVPNLLAAMDVAVCSSDWEGGPLSILEYMQAEVPLVATKVGGIPEMVADGETGVLVPPRDPGAMADAIVRLIDDPAEAKRLATAGAARQHSDYRLETMVERLEERYQRLYAASARR